MPVLVSVRGKESIHPAASHYIVTPTNICHVYTGDTCTASYREWDYAYHGTGDEPQVTQDTPPDGDKSKAMATVPRRGFGSGVD